MTPDVERFLGDLELQRRRYESIVEATEEQNRLIASADLDEVMRVLQRKQAMLQELSSIEARIAPVRDAWEETRGSLDAATIRRVEEAVEGTRAVLQRLLALEEEGRALMDHRRGATGEKIRDLQRKRKVRDAYGKPGGESRFIDGNQ